MAPNKSRRNKRSSSIANQIQKYIRKHAERKFFEHVESAVVNITWTISPCSQPIIQGITGGARVGDNITYAALRMVGRVTANASASVSNFRIVVVLDKMNDGIVPLYTDLFLSNGIDATYSPEQIKSKRFTILHDESYALNTAGIACHMWNRVIRMNQTATFNDATNVTAANGKNSMWIFYITDNSVNKPSLNCNFQMEFTDI